jgi:hypothetical protein
MKRIYSNLIILAVMGCVARIEAGPGMKVMIMLYNASEPIARDALYDLTGEEKMGNMIYGEKNKRALAKPRSNPPELYFQKPTSTTMSQKIIPFGNVAQSSGKQSSMGRTLYGSGKGVSIGAGSKGAGSVGLAGILDKDEAKPGIVQRPMTGLEDMLRMDIQERKSGIVTRADLQARKLELARIKAQQEFIEFLETAPKEDIMRELNILIDGSKAALERAQEAGNEELAIMATNILNAAQAKLNMIS